LSHLQYDIVLDTTILIAKIPPEAIQPKYIEKGLRLLMIMASAEQPDLLDVQGMEIIQKQQLQDLEG
jgi:hypothetical protein